MLFLYYLQYLLGVVAQVGMDPECPAYYRISYAASPWCSSLPSIAGYWCLAVGNSRGPLFAPQHTPSGISKDARGNLRNLADTSCFSHHLRCVLRLVQCRCSFSREQARGRKAGSSVVSGGHGDCFGSHSCLRHRCCCPQAGLTRTASKSTAVV